MWGTNLRHAAWCMVMNDGCGLFCLQPTERTRDFLNRAIENRFRCFCLRKLKMMTRFWHTRTKDWAITTTCWWSECETAPEQISSYHKWTTFNYYEKIPRNMWKSVDPLHRKDEKQHTIEAQNIADMIYNRDPQWWMELILVSAKM